MVAQQVSSWLTAQALPRTAPAVRCQARERSAAIQRRTRAKQHALSPASVHFQPAKEVGPVLESVAHADSSDSFARVGWHVDCEAAVNEQINVELTVSYVYLAMYSFFHRDNIALPGFSAMFKAGHEEERDHALLLMDQQSKRGGRVQLHTLLPPQPDYSNSEKGEALYASELALSLEKLNFQKLRHLHEVGERHNDAQLCDFVERELLEEQAQAVKDAAELVARLRRVGRGLGVYEVDLELRERYGDGVQN
ncbi:hypothetical protein WJX81_004099 [Elliptochloris bilobata]|uniref:Ferritin n=1 Tax=Elliptochloris bilobata TaxID=381761 RepID=A0AAW1SIH8_9CHLO